MPKSIHFLKSPIRTTQDLSSGALDFTTVLTRAFKLEEITIRFDGNVTETVTITRDGGGGASYDVQLARRSLVGRAHFVFRPQGECNFQANENVRVQCTNAGTANNAFVDIKTSEM